MATADNLIRRQYSTVFPKVSYRWRYIDGEYSQYGPFTEAIFEIGTPNAENYYTEGYNTSMCNSVSSITLRNIPRGGPDVVAIDVVYTESDTTNIYLLQTIELPPEVRGAGFEELTIEDRSFGAALPTDQLLRPFDSVPRLARAQEVTASRLVYGDYLQNYDQPSNTTVTTGVELIPLPLNGSSVKTFRPYQIGTVYIDKFGREGALITDPSSSFSTDFTYTNRIRLTVRVTSEPPEWAVRFKHLVRDLSDEHFNLVAHFVYDDSADENSDNVWVQFNSNDISKLNEGDFLIPRRHTDSDPDGVVYQQISRHPVLAISPEAPESVRRALLNLLYNQSPIAGSASSDRFAWVSGFLQPNNQSVANGTGPGLTELYLDAMGSASDELDFQGWFNDLNSFLISSGLDRLDPLVATTGVVNVGDLEGGLYFTLRDHNNGTMIGESIRITGVAVGANNTGTTGGGLDVVRFVLDTPLAGDQFLVTSTGTSNDFTLESRVLSEEGGMRIQGSFFAKIPRTSDSDQINFIPLVSSSFDSDGSILQLRQIYFETERTLPGGAELNLFNEASNTYPIAQHGMVNPIKWSNTIATVDNLGSVLRPELRGIYIESVRIFDRFTSPILDKGVRVNTPSPRYAEERRPHGLIWSGVFNSRTGINELNQFILTNGITKDVNPTFGAIRKLHARDTNLIVMCQDKILRILSEKDALFNADGSSNLTSSTAVLGQTTPYSGEYGISDNPESFSTYGNRIYFADKRRGVFLRLAQNGIVEISENGLKDYFREKLSAETGPIISSYDDFSDVLNVTFSDISVTYDESIEGWTSRKSFVPEMAITLNNIYYMLQNGKLYAANVQEVPRNCFFGETFPSTLSLVFNDAPETIKNFKDVSYEGTPGWTNPLFLTDAQGGRAFSPVSANQDPFGAVGEDFYNKEGKWFNVISGISDQDLITTIQGFEAGDVKRNPIDFYNDDRYDGQAYRFSDGAFGTGALDVSGIGVANSSTNTATTTEFTFTGSPPSQLQSATLAYIQDDSPIAIGSINSVTASQGTFTIAVARIPGSVPASAFLVYMQEAAIESSGLIGYEAMSTFINNEMTPQNIFAVTTEAFESSR